MSISMIMLSALVISLIVAVVGYYLQTQLRALLDTRVWYSRRARRPQENREKTAVLVVRSGPRTVRELELRRKVTIIGRDERLCHLAIPDDPYISRRHAIISFENPF